MVKGAMFKSRREEYADATRQALLDAAEAAFVERGYANAALDEIAREARVTKGALYHHFENKQALFEAVFRRLERAMAARTAEAASSVRDPLQRTVAGFSAFLEACEDRSFRRIVLEEGPHALGWERWRELDDPFGISLIRPALQGLVDDGVIRTASVDLLARMVFGALTEAGLAIAAAPPAKRTATRRAAERTIGTMLRAFRPPPDDR